MTCPRHPLSRARHRVLADPQSCWSRGATGRDRPARTNLLFAKGAHPVLAGLRRLPASTALDRALATHAGSVSGGAATVATAWLLAPRSSHADAVSCRWS